MPVLELSKLVRFKNPLPGEEDLIFNITNYNDVTKRCYIQLINPLNGISPIISPQELVSIDDLVNVE